MFGYLFVSFIKYKTDNLGDEVHSFCTGDPLRFKCCDLLWTVAFFSLSVQSGWLLLLILSTQFFFYLHNNHCC